jgi:acyl transferase domain-containing protein/SAM-dependent methyltransferase
MSGTGAGEAQLSPIKRALLEIRELRSKLAESENSMKEPIAVIGVGLRFPGGANTPESFWRLLREGVDAITEVPRDRWDVNAFYDPDPDAPGKMSTRWGGFLEDIDKCDPEFFRISPREAMTMDPQQRLLLEVVWEALENAGHAPSDLFDSQTGVFVGIATFDYFQEQLQNLDPKYIDPYFATGGIHSVASGRISYVLGLRGPSISLDTACSSSLVAIHLACQSLRAKECDTALAGGVNLILRPELHINFSKTHVLAADGRCKAFDAGADGFVRSEGCGIIVLKRLSDALRDLDNVHAVIRGTAVNQDGRSSGLTVPNGPSQQDVIVKALSNGGVKASQVQYIEAHGTGTELGDPIEVQALAEVFGKDRSHSNPLLIGSVKTNIGHLETAAGVAGLIKLVLSVKHGEIPPHLHLKQSNPHIPWSEIPIRVPTDGVPWPNIQGKRIGGVSSFGFSGTNSHVVVEEPPSSGDSGNRNEYKRSLQLLTISGRTESALKEQIDRYIDYLSRHPDESIDDICYTANTGRTHFEHRLSLITESTRDAVCKLKTARSGNPAHEVFAGRSANSSPPELVFLFSGQSLPHINMGRQLYEEQPAFRSAVDHCCDLLENHLDKPLQAVLYPDNPSESKWPEGAYAQLGLFVLEYALAVLWRSWGVKPAAVMGEAIGEWVAACIAGVVGLEDALHLVFARSLFMESLERDGNTRAGVSQANSVCSSVHLSNTDSTLEVFQQALFRSTMNAPSIPMIWSLTGDFCLQGRLPDPDYWKRQTFETSRYACGIQTLYEKGYRLFIEIGPDSSVSSFGKRLVSGEDAIWLPSLNKGANDWKQMLTALGTIYACGDIINWKEFFHHFDFKRTTLPTYPFQKDRYWWDSSAVNPAPPETSHVPNPQSEDGGGAKDLRPVVDQSAIWRFALDSGRRQADQGPFDLDVASYPEKWRLLERLTVAYITRALVLLGVFKRSNERYSTDEIMERFFILPIYRKLLYRWLNRLTGTGRLHLNGGLFTNPRPLEMPSFDLLLNEARLQFANETYLVDYIERCGNLLTEILTGRLDPLETIFPGGSSQLAESLYGDWVVSRQISGIAASIVSSMVSANMGADPFHILEIGAGTGGTTGTVIRALPPRPVEYWFTDVSEFFFIRAQAKYKNYPFMRYRAFDIEKRPADQGLPVRAFDVVLATNVLHATLNLEATVDNVLALLAPGGILVLSEVTEDFAWLDITYALTEGWQKFEDKWRKERPLLSPRQWEEILKGRGFQDVEIIPEAGSISEVLGQHVVVARSPASGRLADSMNIIGPVPVAAPVRPDDLVIGVEEKLSKFSDEFLQILMDAPLEERRELLVDCVQNQLAIVLRLAPDSLPNRSGRLMDLGVDSLIAVEFRNRLGEVLGLKCKLPATLVFDYPTAEAIAGFLEREFLDTPGEVKPEPEQMSETIAGKTITAEKIADMSDEQVESMLLERLKKKQGTKE